jgi:hypothetical protein
MNMRGSVVVRDTRINRNPANGNMSRSDTTCNSKHHLPVTASITTSIVTTVNNITMRLISATSFVEGQTSSAQAVS